MCDDAIAEDPTFDSRWHPCIYQIICERYLVEVMRTVVDHNTIFISGERKQSLFHMLPEQEKV